MSNLAKTDFTGLANILHGDGAIDIPRPFEREIFLFSTHVAGTTHVPNIDALDPDIHVGDSFDFFRDAENVKDGAAIEVRMESGDKVGFVPQKDNIVFSRLMDAGKLLFGKVSTKERKGNWLRIGMDIYLKD